MPAQPHSSGRRQGFTGTWTATVPNNLAFLAPTCSPRGGWLGNPPRSPRKQRCVRPRCERKPASRQVAPPPLACTVPLRRPSERPQTSASWPVSAAQGGWEQPWPERSSWAVQGPELLVQIMNNAALTYSSISACMCCLPCEKF